MIWFYRDFLDGILYIIIALLALVFIMAIIGFIMEKIQFEKEEKNRVAVLEEKGAFGSFSQSDESVNENLYQESVSLDPVEISSLKVDESINISNQNENVVTASSISDDYSLDSTNFTGKSDSGLSNVNLELVTDGIQNRSNEVQAQESTVSTSIEKESQGTIESMRNTNTEVIPTIVLEGEKNMPVIEDFSSLTGNTSGMENNVNPISTKEKEGFDKVADNIISVNSENEVIPVIESSPVYNSKELEDSNIASVAEDDSDLMIQSDELATISSEDKENTEAFDGSGKLTPPIVENVDTDLPNTSNDNNQSLEQIDSPDADVNANFSSAMKQNKFINIPSDLEETKLQDTTSSN